MNEDEIATIKESLNKKYIQGWVAQQIGCHKIHWNKVMKGHRKMTQKHINLLKELKLI